MADSRKAAEVAGFRVVQAVKKAKAHTAPGSAPPPRAPAPPPKPVEDHAERKARFGKTALPSRHEAACYHCGYGFTYAGRSQNLVCPKCHRALDQSDHVVDTIFESVLRTTGKISITEDGVMLRGEIVARDVLVAGRIDGGTIHASGEIALAGKAEYGEGIIHARDLRIEPNARVLLNYHATFRNVAIFGSLTATLVATGLVTIHPGGRLAGSIHGPRLVVEEGGGLKAETAIAPHPSGAPA